MSEFIPNLYLPSEILTDDRLTLRQIRVLMAIFSWRKSNTNLARVSRDMLLERTGYAVNKISAITTDLVNLGWLEKVGNGGKSQWCEYRVKELKKSPVLEVKQAEKTTHSEFPNPTQFGEGLESVTLPDLGRGALPDLGRGIDTARNTVIKSSSNSEAVDNFFLKGALASFKNEKGVTVFTAAQMTSPRVLKTLMDWQRLGASVEDLNVVVKQVISRGTDLRSPLYLDGPLRDWMKEKSGEAEVLRKKVRLPHDDNELERWALGNGFSKPKPKDTFFDYRARLRAELRKRVGA